MDHRGRQSYDARITALALVLVAVSAVYWSAYAINGYNTFHEYYDFGIFAYNVAFYFNHPALAQGLQFLVYGNHISPDMLLFVMPVYALYRSPIALLLVQAVMVSLAGLAVFFAARGLLGKQYVALAFMVAFLLSPGIHGLLLENFHTEMFVPLFYIMTFYFCMKCRTAPFSASLVLLLGSLESVVPVALMLGVGLLAYERFYDRDTAMRPRRMKFAAAIVIATIAAGAFYYLTTSYLTNAYASGLYPSLPSMFEIGLGSQVTLASPAAALLSVGTLSSSLRFFAYYPAYTVFALLVVLLSFGVAMYFDVIVAALFLLPFAIGFILLTPSLPFIVPYFQYYAFAVPGIASASLLGILAAGGKRSRIGRLLEKRGIDVTRFAAIACISMALLVFAFSIYVMHQDQFLHNLVPIPSQSEQVQDAQVDSVLALIPANASVMAFIPIMTHLSGTERLESFSNRSYFTPQYVIVDFGLNVSANEAGLVPVFDNMIDNESYQVYAENGTAILLKAPSQV